MAEPTLGEITNLKVDPELGTGNIGYAIDNRDLVRNLTQAAQFKSQNDWKKYNLFLEDTKEKYKDAQEIASMDVAPQDRDRLEKEMTGFLNDMATNPKDFFSSVGSAKGKELQQRLIDWRKDATTSKNDNLWDKQNRKFLAENPDHDTPENRQKIEGFLTNQKLGGRQPYILDMPSAYDPTALAKELNTAVEQKVAQPGMTPDGKFTYTETGSKYNPDQYRKIASSIFDLNQKGFQNTIVNLFKKIPPTEQIKYKDRENPAKDWFLDFQDTFRKPDQVTKDDLKANPFALESERAKTKLNELNVKFGYDKILEKLKSGDRQDLEKLKIDLKDGSRKDQVGALKGMVDTMVNDAIANPINFSEETATGKVFYDMDVSPSTLKIFSKVEGEGPTKKTVYPDAIQVSADGKTVRVVNYKGGQSKSIGNEIPDSDATKIQKFSIDEFTARFGKDVLGVAATEKEINSGEDSDQKPVTASKNIYKAKMPNGNIITSVDGINWVDSNGKAIK